MLHRLLPILFLLLLPACTRRTLTLESVSGYTALTVDYPTRVLSGTDATTADFYLTDLPPELWRPGTDLTGVSGTLVHLHLFLPPSAGRAPMGENASNINIRYIIIAGGEVGVYAGGGFLFLDGKPSRHGDEPAVWTSAGGSFSAASMRLIRRTENFRDILGPSQLSGKFDAKPQADSALILSARIRQIMDTAGKVE